MDVQNVVVVEEAGREVGRGRGERVVKVEKEAEQERGMRGNVHRRVAS
ncbi:MAG: hypothetical protein N2V74_00550 [Candidatus Methanospirare jalkutatii]|nr:MAG: hypothetical protein N2V74_00550 [Candidatus Methanospirare jalkutatii]